MTTPIPTSAVSAPTATATPSASQIPAEAHWQTWAERALLVLLSFVPLLSVDPGIVTSDTKTYLYLDPSRFLGQVTSMWLPTVALGTTTHQYVGYLLPMGPYYAMTALLHVPTWVAQRIWLGAILFVAGAGVLRLSRMLGARGPGPAVAACAYMLSPYVLQYAGRISVLLLPWAGLPWMVVFVALALRKGGWKYPALFALTVAVTSGINASSALYVLVAPVLWLVWAAVVERETTWRRAGAVLAKAAALCVLACAWWIVGLVVEAGYGVDVLRSTESLSATSSTSSASEVLRGLGYWYFYGGGRLGPWTRSVVLYTRWLWLVAASFAVPVLSVAAGVLVRWRHRGYFVVLLVVGLVLSVGAFPYAHPTPLGSVLKAFMNDTTAGLAMRSTDRATPLVLLGLAALLGAGISALWMRRNTVGWVVGGLVLALVVANNPAMFNGDAQVVAGATQPASLPSYETEALHHLDSVHPTTRVLAIPGDSFGAYTWGDTTDTPQPALLTRPFVTREQQVMGSTATADTLYALDEPIQTTTQNWAGLAPMARLLSAGDVLVEYDQDSTLYAAPQARLLAQSLATTPPGLSDRATWGTPGHDVAPLSLDAQALAQAPTTANPGPTPLATYTVTDPRPIARAESDSGAIVVAGDATGIESLASQGLLDTTSAIYYAGTLDADPSQLRTLLAKGATLVVTDTDRKQSFSWNTLSANTGLIQTATDDTTGATPATSPIELFPGAPADAQTLATYIGAADVTASSYGNPVADTPEDRPSNALDGDPLSAWETGTFTSDVDGQWWQVALGHTTTTDHVTLVQPRSGTTKRRITKVTLTFDGSHPVTVRLGGASRRGGGQQIDFPRRTFSTLRVTIDATSSAHGTPVGFSTVAIPGQSVEEVDQMPEDLLHDSGARSLADRLVVTMTRTRVSPYGPRQDPETTISRSFTLPTARTFTLSGTATLSVLDHDDQIQRLLGVAGSTGSGVVAFSSSRLEGDLGATAAAAADGNPATAWQPGMGGKDQVGAWLQYDTPDPVTFDHLTLQVVTDHHHSVPEAITLAVTTTTTGATAHRALTLPTLPRSNLVGTRTAVPLTFAPVTGQRIRVTFTKVRLTRAPNVNNQTPVALPMAIADVGIPGVEVAPAPAKLPGRCQSDLLSIDGTPVTLEIVGSSSAALDDGQVTLQPCGADAEGIRLSPGHHVVESALATSSDAAPTGLGCAAVGCTGWSIDTLTLDSAPGGGPQATAAEGSTSLVAPPRTLRSPAPGPAPTVATTGSSPTTRTVTITRAHDPFELVLGESINAGWRAVAHPGRAALPGAHSVDLGTPQLVDAFANGWQVSADDLHSLGVGSGAGSSFTVTVTWEPQTFVWTGIAVSGAALVVCLLLAFLPATWRQAIRRRIRVRRLSAQPRAGRADTVVPAAPTRPVLAGLVRSSPGVTPAWWVVALCAVATGAVALAVSNPLGGAAAALAVAVGLSVRPLRRVGGLVAVGLLVAGAVIVVASQAVHKAPAGGNWPGASHLSATITTVAIGLLVADVVADYGTRVVRRRRA